MHKKLVNKNSSSIVKKIILVLVHRVNIRILLTDKSMLVKNY